MGQGEIQPWADVTTADDEDAEARKGFDLHKIHEVHEEEEEEDEEVVVVEKKEEQFALKMLQDGTGGVNEDGRYAVSV